MSFRASCVFGRRTSVLEPDCRDRTKQIEDLLEQMHYLSVLHKRSLALSHLLALQKVRE